MNHLTGVCQQPESLRNGRQALADYIRIVQTEAEKRLGAGLPTRCWRPQKNTKTKRVLEESSMANEFELSPKELKKQADALLAAADAAEKAAEREPAARSAKKSTRKKGEETVQEAPAVMTDEEARKAGILRLDDKQVAALPAAAWLMNNEKLRELLARGKRRASWTPRS